MIEALQRGVAPITFVRHVVELVRPRLTVEPASAPHRKGRITDFTRLISLNLGAEELVSLKELNLDAVQDLAFFDLLASQLEGELRYGLARAARIGGSAVYFANWIERVYPAQLVDSNGGVSDPDEYRRGFGPLVKFLHQVVEKLHAIEPKWRGLTCKVGVETQTRSSRGCGRRRPATRTLRLQPRSAPSCAQSKQIGSGALGTFPK
jgi:hypothetical protein